MKNFGFGIANGKVRLRIAFPNTFDETASESSPFLSEQMQEDFLDHVLLPAVISIHRLSNRHWPLSYYHRKWASRNSTGQFIYQRRSIPRNHTKKLLRTMHQILRTKTGHPDLYPRLLPMLGFVVYWEVQDIKLDTPFEPDLSAAPDHPQSYQSLLRNKAMKAAFSGMRVNLLDPEHTHVDIAVEMYAHHKSIYFRRNGHASILHHLLGYSEGTARRMAFSQSPGAAYQRDHFVGMRDIAGFHLKLSGTSSPEGILYAQAYHTEKEIGYQSSSRNKMVPLRPVDLLRGRNDEKSQYPKWTEGALRSLQSQIKNGIANNARLEVTVPLRRLETVDINFNDDLIEECLVALDANVIP